MIPAMHDRVRVEGSDETYLVVGVDYGKKIARLVPAGGDAAVAEDVPFNQLQGTLLADAFPDD